MKKKISIKLYIISALVILGAVVGSIMLMERKDAHASNDSKERLITIYDRDSQKTFVSKATTVSEALEDADVSLESSDIVEPAKDSALVAPTYRINIYRARPVIVVDGATRNKVMTPYQTPKQIAESVGITVYPEDIAEMRLTSNLLADGASLEMIIKRATPIYVDLFGKNLSLRTQAKTVEGFLQEKDIKLSEKDRVSVALNTEIQPGMNFRVWREGKQTISEEQAVQFEVEQIRDADRPIGYKSIRTPGVLGKKNVTYEIEIVNGAEVSRREIARVTLAPASKQVEIVGAQIPGVPYTGSGQKTDWMRAAGIPESDWGYVDYIIQKESNWNPNSVNKNTGACGLAQAMPCSKVPGNPLDPVDNLRWANGYAHTCVSYRMYCGWEGAYSFWITHRWW